MVEALAGMRRSWIGLVAFALSLGALAVDHLLGTDEDDDSYALDYPAFAIGGVLCLVAAAVLYGWIVPRARRAGPDRAARDGLVASLLSVVPGIAFLWFGFPIVVAGAGIDLGLDGRGGRRRTLATVAIVVGAALIAFATVYYVVAAVGTLS